MNQPSHALRAVAAALGLLASGLALAQAAPAAPVAPVAPADPRAHPPIDGPAARPGPPVPPPDRGGVPTTVTGTVARWLPNPNGDVDGLLLGDGTQVAFPPHLSARVLGLAKLQDTVQVTGRRSPEAGVVRAAELRNTATGRTVADDAAPGSRPPPPPPGRGASALTAMTGTGRIATVLHTGRGDANGAVLDDGTVVRFPPHVGSQMAASLQAGKTLFASGYGTRSANGAAFEATRMGASASEAQPVFAGPHGPGGRGGPGDPGGTAGPGGPGARGPAVDDGRAGPAAGRLPPPPRPDAATPGVPVAPARSDAATTPQ